MKKKLLIIGINGFLGSALAKKLNKNFEIFGLVRSENLTRINSREYKLANINFISIDKLLETTDFFGIINAATIYSFSPENFGDFIKTNLVLPLTIYLSANSRGVKYFINSDTFFNNPEFYNYEYLSEYILSKKNLKEWLLKLSDKTTVVNLKLFHMFGPGDNENKFVMNVLKKLKDNVDKIDLTLGEQKRDFIYIDDVVSAYETILNSKLFNKGKFFEYEVGYAEAISIRDFVTELKKSLKSRTELKFGAIPYRENEVFNSKSDNKALIKLGWKPIYNFKSGIKMLIKKTNNKEYGY